MRTSARFPALDPGDGHYESFYVKAAAPEGGRAVWIRHTVHKRPDADPTASVWFTLFDARATGPRAVKQTFDAAELSVPEGAYIEVAGSHLEPGRATGSASAPALEAAWDLSFADGGEAFRHLPHPRLYEAPIPRTKLLSPHPGASFDGTLTVGGERIELAGWPGMVGHNWGAEHAERWVWIHGGALDGQAGSCFDLAAGRIKLGPLTTPWVANGVLRLDGAEHRLGGLGSVFRLKLDDEPTSCAFEVPGDGVKVTGSVRAEPRDVVAWVYADPDGPEHNTLNCSISDLRLEVLAGEGEARTIEVPAGAAYEIGMRETDHGIPLQPYPDG